MTKMTEEQLQKKIKKWKAKDNPITRRQAKQQLVIMGLEQQALDTIANITDETEKRLIGIWYDDASVWERENDQLKNFASEMGMTEEQVDDFFIQALKL